MNAKQLYKEMKVDKLTTMKCKPCEGGVPPLNSQEIAAYMKGIDKDWHAVANKRIIKTFSFVNYMHTMDFVNRIAALAEEEGHHPVMHVQYGKLEVELWTHAINGLSENDFIMAAKIDAMQQGDR